MSSAALVLIATLASPTAQACTRVLYVGDDGLVLTGRTMDWGEDIRSNLWVFPRGMKRDGASGANTVEWTSKYGSIDISAYDAGTTDGMNEQGLVMSGLYLAESDYGKPDGRPTMSVMALGQYLLDSFGSVAEAVELVGTDSFRLVAPALPNGRAATAHIALSDPTGDSAIFEWIGGKVVVHHGESYRVMTNSPTFDEQLAIERYWKGVDPLTFLPGSINAADRFARVSFLLDAIPTKMDPNTISAVPDGTYQNQAVAAVMSVVRAISVPLGITHPTKPNIASTLWRTVWDHTHRVLFFDSATSPNTFWVRLDEIDFSERAPVRKLTLAGGRIYSGDATRQFDKAPSFAFLPADPG
jgi:penicillin V acylase-like amidase (Ntn superfamily)